MIEWMSAILLCLGASMTLLAGVGVLRLPDLFTRMHAITKAGTLGIGLSLLAVALYYFDLGISTRALAAIAFVLLTAPVGSHLMGRAAYLADYPLWEGTRTDVLGERLAAATAPDEEGEGTEEA